MQTRQLPASRRSRHARGRGAARVCLAQAPGTLKLWGPTGTMKKRCYHPWRQPYATWTAGHTGHWRPGQALSRAFAWLTLQLRSIRRVLLWGPYAGHCVIIAESCPADEGLEREVCVRLCLCVHTDSHVGACASRLRFRARARRRARLVSCGNIRWCVAVPPPVLGMFVQCFNKGGRKRRGGGRPAAQTSLAVGHAFSSQNAPEKANPGPKQNPGQAGWPQRGACQARNKVCNRCGSFVLSVLVR